MHNCTCVLVGANLRADSSVVRRTPVWAESANLQYARGLYNWGFPLPLGEIAGLYLVRVDASEALAILVKHRDLKMLVLAPAVFAELGVLSNGFCFRHSFNISIQGWAHKYRFGQYSERNQIKL